MHSERNHGIDLLRLVLMFMVCLLHILGQGGVLAASSVDSTAFGAFGFLKVCAYCAVDGFAIISGYVSSNREQKWHKIVNMWFQVVFYSFVLTAIFHLFGVGSEMGIREWIRSLLPVTGSYFWYFTAYFALFFAMPVLNRFIDPLSPEAARKAMVIIIVLFSGIGLPDDAFAMRGGYSTLWLIVLYCMGGLAKKTNLFSKKKSFPLIVLYLGLTTLSWGVYMLFKESRLVSYIAPTMLFNALILVVLFSRIRIKGAIVGKLSPLAFGVYLFQLNSVVWKDILKDRLRFIASDPLAVGLCYVIFFSAVLFAAGLIVEWLRSQLAKALRIPALSQKIVNLTGKLLSKAAVIFR